MQRARQLLQAARDRMTSTANRHRSEVSFRVGQEVLLNTKNLTFKGPSSKKFLPRWIGPFPIAARVGNVAYRLCLLPHMKIHPVFHVSLLRPYRSDGRHQPPPPILTLEGEEEYEVERILDHRTAGRSRRLEFLVRWSGYGPEHDRWEPQDNLENCPLRLQEYWDFVGRRPAPRSRRQRRQ